jgi:hypothetical protein
MDLGAIISHERTQTKLADDVLATLKQEAKSQQIASELLKDLVKDSIQESLASIRMGISTWAVTSETFVDAYNMALKRANQIATKKLAGIDVTTEESWKIPERPFVEQEQMNQILGSREPHMLKTL